MQSVCDRRFSCSTDVLRARVVAPRPTMGIPIPVFRKDDEAAASPSGTQGSLEPCRFGRYSRRLERNPFRCARSHGPLGGCLRAVLVPYKRAQGLLEPYLFGRYFRGLGRNLFRHAYT